MLSTQIRTLLLEIQHGRHFKLWRNRFFSNIIIYQISYIIYHISYTIYISWYMRDTPTSLRAIFRFSKILSIICERRYHHLHCTHCLRSWRVKPTMFEKSNMLFYSRSPQSAVSSCCFICLRETVSFWVVVVSYAGLRRFKSLIVSSISTLLFL